MRCARPTLRRGLRLGVGERGQRLQAGTFKPAPAVYRLVTHRFGCAPPDISFQSSIAGISPAPRRSGSGACGSTARVQRTNIPIWRPTEWWATSRDCSRDRASPARARSLWGGHEAAPRTSKGPKGRASERTATLQKLCFGESTTLWAPGAPPRAACPYFSRRVPRPICLASCDRAAA